MIAAWYERPGPAAEVLQVGEMPDPEPGPGEVRIRLTISGINPGDTKKRGDWVGDGLPYPRVIPHSDGAGVIDAVGDGVDRARVGERVWVHGAQSYRPFGTAAQCTVVPAEQAVALPDEVADELGACLGIPGITAHRAVFGDGPVAGSDGPRPRRPRRRRLDGGAARGVERSDRDRNGAAQQRSLARSTTRSRIAWRSTRPIRCRRSAASLRTASIASSRSPSPTTPTSTPPSPRPRR